MAASKLKAPLAILRSIIGKNYGSEVLMAQKIGKSTSWLRKASCGQIPIFRATAVEISNYTGIHPEWIMEGDPTVPPIDINGDEYTFETFKNIPKKETQSTKEISDAIIILAESINKLANAITERKTRK